jgi:hypothetical protein
MTFHLTITDPKSPAVLIAALDQAIEHIAAVGVPQNFTPLFGLKGERIGSFALRANYDRTPPPSVDALNVAKLCAAEFGFRCGEKGYNLERTLQELQRVLKTNIVWGGDTPPQRV